MGSFHCAGYGTFLGAQSPWKLLLKGAPGLFIFIYFYFFFYPSDAPVCRTVSHQNSEVSRGCQGELSRFCAAARALPGVRDRSDFPDATVRCPWETGVPPAAPGGSTAAFPHPGPRWKRGTASGSSAGAPGRGPGQRGFLVPAPLCAWKAANLSQAFPKFDRRCRAFSPLFNRCCFA